MEMRDKKSEEKRKTQPSFLFLSRAPPLEFHCHLKTTCCARALRQTAPHYLTLLSSERAPSGPTTATSTMAEATFTALTQPLRYKQRTKPLFWCGHVLICAEQQHNIIR